MFRIAGLCLVPFLAGMLLLRSIPGSGDDGREVAIADLSPKPKTSRGPELSAARSTRVEPEEARDSSGRDSNSPSRRPALPFARVTPLPVPRELIACGDPFAREMALDILAPEAGEDPVSAVRRALIQDTDPIVRARAARLLAEHDPSSSLTVLVECALSDSSRTVRAAALSALIGVEDPRAVRALEILAGDPAIDEDLRLVASLALEERILVSDTVRAPRRKHRPGPGGTAGGRPERNAR